jgi:hypothetical protein
MRRQAEVILFLSDARGIHIPQNFAECMKRHCVTGVSTEDWDVLINGPDIESYWDVWSNVCDNAVITAPDTGVKYTIHQDGDCWLVEEGAEFDESSDFDLGMYIDDGTGETAPSAWASYLMNGDSSGIDSDNELYAIDRWVLANGGRSPIACEDAGFIKHHDAFYFCPFGADCQRYKFPE